MPWYLIVTHAIAAAAGKIVPWHYEDFASSCRTGADAARKIRQRLTRLSEHLGHLSDEVHALPSGTAGVYRHLLSVQSLSDDLRSCSQELFALRDDDLETAITNFYDTLKNRTLWVLHDVLPVANRPDGLSDPKALEMMAMLDQALKETDIPMCTALIVRVARRSTWFGFAWSRPGRRS